MEIIKIILCLFLPPLAVFMQVGATRQLWINIILTLLGGVPGVVHALWIVLTGKTSDF